ncbi:DoxX family protein [Methylomonas sp. EbB]|uniref:DoxX family protein n=2 Tax=Methylomonas fluvii TaxID=1854564 RepID=A0ABR9DFT5_9GAMM|nr:DoxX family protein [Methylomonas fluvii]
MIAKLLAPFYQPQGWGSRCGLLLGSLTPWSSLLLRCWVAYAFWISGLLKIQSWDSTLYLFENEYAVPLLPADLAAVLATAIELIGPVLLALGLCGRVAAVLLFLLNIVAVISYPDLGGAGIEQHKEWGVMLLVCCLQGPGKLSLDAWISRYFFPVNVGAIRSALKRENA